MIYTTNYDCITNTDSTMFIQITFIITLMAAFLRNKTKKKITSVKIHPMAKDLLSLIEALNLSIKPQQLSDQLITLIEETIKLEGVLDIETGEF